MHEFVGGQSKLFLIFGMRIEIVIFVGEFILFFWFIEEIGLWILFDVLIGGKFMIFGGFESI